MHARHLLRTHDECDLGRGDHAFNQVIRVKAGGGVFEANAAVGGVRVHRPRVAVAGDDDIADGVMKGRTAGLEG